MKLQKIFLILGLIIISLSIFFIINFLIFQASEEAQLIEGIEQTIERHQEKLIEDQAIEEKKEENIIDETEKVTEPIKEFFSEAVHKAIDFFQHKEIRMSAIGDSLTQGVGDETDGGGYVGIIQNTLKTHLNQPTVIIENFGKRGNRTDQLLARLEDDLEEDLQQSVQLADIILVTIGANDIMEVFKQNILDLTIEPFLKEQIHYEQRLHRIFNQLIEQNTQAKIYLLGIYNPFKQYFEDIEELEQIVNDWNRINEKVTAEYEQIDFIPIKDIFDDAEEHLFADDNFHPNYLGYQYMAERVLEYLTDSEEE